MNNLTNTIIKSPYLIFTGDESDLKFAKTGAGIVQWSRDKVAGQLRFDGNPLDLGVPDLTIKEASEKGVKSLIIGVAPVGGKVGDDWLALIVEAANLGIDIVSGLHLRLEEYPAIVEAANQSGAKLVNVRVPPENLPIGTGKKRSGNRLLMVGTDCAVGKKYSALAITKALKANGVNATFRATGQTGIMISGAGIPVDSVVSDFIAGASEVISPDNDNDHWDVIEGQGSLFNPSYAGVSLGLLHGSQPDAIVVCHDPCREAIISSPEMKLPSIQECIDLNLQCARLTNPNVYCLGVCINTSNMTPADAEEYLKNLSASLQLPCVDPLKDGLDSFSDRIISHNKSFSA